MNKTTKDILIIFIAIMACMSLIRRIITLIPRYEHKESIIENEYAFYGFYNNPCWKSYEQCYCEEVEFDYRGIGFDDDGEKELVSKTLEREVCYLKEKIRVE